MLRQDGLIASLSLCSDGPLWENDDLQFDLLDVVNLELSFYKYFSSLESVPNSISNKLEAYQRNSPLAFVMSLFPPDQLFVEILILVNHGPDTLLDLFMQKVFGNHS
ncbi:hypothetical protein AVEN_255435-1 [Araneus ventricosus]|uniref:Uncharacterized protein n=1 Tax=Araneus ventricosus TaxID=182803 RepID=A0A4Y2HNP6_ARAVE|nr:hypothetical protein AVEN_255435-1 [Araneus ventricosus]